MDATSSCTRSAERRSATALAAARTAWALHGVAKDSKDFAGGARAQMRRLTALCGETRTRAAAAASIRPSVEADCLEAAGWLAEPDASNIDYARANARTALRRAVVAVEREAQVDDVKKRKKREDARRASARGDSAAADRLEKEEKETSQKTATLRRELYRGLAAVSGSLGDKAARVAALEKSLGEGGARQEAKARPAGACVAQLELAEARLLSGDDRGAAEAAVASCEAGAVAAALSAFGGLDDEARAGDVSYVVDAVAKARDVGGGAVLKTFKRDYANELIDAGAWLPLKNTGDALHLLRVAEAASSASRAAVLIPALSALRHRNGLGLRTAAALDRIRSALRDAEKAPRVALASAPAVADAPAPPRLVAFKKRDFAALRDGSALVAAPVSSLVADVDLERATSALTGFAGRAETSLAARYYYSRFEFVHLGRRREVWFRNPGRSPPRSRCRPRTRRRIWPRSCGAPRTRF